MKKLKLGVMILGCAVLAITGNAATNDVSGLLQKGLFEEEANRNLEAAIQAYQGVIAQTDKDRKFGATAIFRLGECYRKLGKTNEANEQYARIVREFPEQTELVKLSQQHGGTSTVMLAPTQQAAIASGVRQQEATAEAETLARQLAAIKELPTDKRRILIQQQYGNPVIDALMQKLVDAEQQLDIDKQSKTGSHPDVVRAEATIQKLHNQIDQQVNGVILGLEMKEKAARETAKIMEERRRQETATTAKSGSDTAAVKPMTTGSAEDEQIRRIQAMIKNSPDLINATDNEGLTPLEKTASLGQLTVAKFLLENKASLQVGQGRKTPLHLAADNGHKAMVELLLSSGADVNVRDNSGQTPLHLAASKGFIGVSDVLIERGADINARDNEKMTPLHRAVSKGKSAVAEFLIEKKAEVNTRSERGETALISAVTSRAPKTAEILLKHGADVNAQLMGSSDYEYNDWTALHFAVKLNQVEMVKLLLEHGARPGMLVNYRTEPNSPGTSVKAAPLHMAANQRQKEIGQLLLNAKGDVDIRDGNGRTPLHYSVEKRDKAFCEMLLAHKADVNARNDEGQAPLLLAARFNYPEITELLLQNGADSNATDEKGLPVLFSALRPEMFEVPQLLIEKGADVNVQDKYGNKPLDWIQGSKNGYSAWYAKIAKLLRDKGGTSTAEFSTIRVTRAGLDVPVEFFRKDKEGLNRYTLYELLGKVYGSIQTSFPFPNLNRVSIKRRLEGQDKTANIEVKLKDMLDSDDCTKDMWLEWGDVVDIPEADHNISASWGGLLVQQADTLDKCLARKVEIIVKGQTNQVLLLSPMAQPRSAGGFQAKAMQKSRALPGVQTPDVSEEKTVKISGFRLYPVIREAGVLLASSDLSRVKVSRLDPVTKQRQEIVYDLSQASGSRTPGGLSYSWTAPTPGLPARTLRQSSPGGPPAQVEPYNVETDLWLRDGDVIEIPEKP